MGGAATMTRQAEARGAAESGPVEALLGLQREAYSLALRVAGSRDAAEDAVQDAYLAAIKNMRTAGPPQELRPWFFKTVVNSARMRSRAEARRAAREKVTAPPAVVPAAAPDAERIAAVREALGGLDEQYRLALSLCYEHDLTRREAAEVLSLPEGTVATNVNRGLDRLRQSLARMGYAAAAPALIELLKVHTIESAPASLAAAINELVSAGGAVKATGAATASVAAKGGMAVKIVAGVIAAGVLAGGVAVAPGLWGKGPSPLPSPAGRGSEGEGKPAPANPYAGMQEREEVFEFAEKPKAVKDGEKTVITFASKGNCDATVAIVDKDGKIVRHLASGVLGKNAPWPFQQNSLVQKVEWDGQTDDFKKAPDGCKVKVGLGLQAAFERSIAYDPYNLPSQASDVTQNDVDKGKFLVGTGPDGNLYVLGLSCYSAWIGCVFTKDGKYVRTWWPPAAADLEKTVKLGYGVNATTWGDKVPVQKGKAAFFTGLGDARKKALKDIGKPMFDMAGIADFKEGPRPESVPAGKTFEMVNAMFSKVPRMSVDSNTEDLYAGGLGAIVRLSGKTGENDASWKTPGKWGKPDVPWKGYGDTAVGLDGLIYARIGEHERFLQRTDREGKLVPFKDALYPPDPKIVNDKYGGYVPPKGALISGSMGSGNTYMDGLCVAPDGTVLFEIHSWMVKDLADPKAMRVALADSNKCATAAKDLGVDYLPEGENKQGSRHWYGGYFITLWTPDGKLITQDAVEGKGIGDGAYMDREGNIYTVQGGASLDGQKTMDGLASGGVHGGSLIKFRGLGGKYPLGTFHGKLGYYGGSTKPAPADAMKMTFQGKPIQVSGALWAYGVPNQSANDCNCPHSRFYLDRFARSWVPATQVCSVMLLDSNGNRIARLGRYGNVDDTEADLKEKKDGLRIIYPRAVTASDTALYVMDYGSRRILKAALSYHAEETVPLP